MLVRLYDLNCSQNWTVLAKLLIVLAHCVVCPIDTSINGCLTSRLYGRALRHTFGCTAAIFPSLPDFLRPELLSGNVTTAQLIDTLSESVVLVWLSNSEIAHVVASLLSRNMTFSGIVVAVDSAASTQRLVNIRVGDSYLSSTLTRVHPICISGAESALSTLVSRTRIIVLDLQATFGEGMALNLFLCPFYPVCWYVLLWLVAKFDSFVRIVSGTILHVDSGRCNSFRCVSLFFYFLISISLVLIHIEYKAFNFRPSWILCRLSVYKLIYHRGIQFYYPC